MKFPAPSHFVFGLALAATGVAPAAAADVAEPPRFVDLTSDASRRPPQLSTVTANEPAPIVTASALPPRDAAPVLLYDRTTATPGRPGPQFTGTLNRPPEAMKADNPGAVALPDAELAADRDSDPYEADNRERFDSHVALHHDVVDPVEGAYTGIVPEAARHGLHNFLTNLEGPGVLANDLLQANLTRSANTFSRLVLNTTIGLAGFLDVASGMGIPYHDDDFGQTLAIYGVDDGPYLLVPVVGPTNPRDLTGKIVDYFLNPLHYVVIPGGMITTIGQAGLHQLDKRSDQTGDLDVLMLNSSDPYATERHVARMKRQADIEKQ